MIDISIKLALLAVAAALLTRRGTHRSAADAHRLWGLVVFSPVALLIANAMLPPIAFVIPRSSIPAVGAFGVSWVWVAYVVVALALLTRVAVGLAAVDRLKRRAPRLSGATLGRLRALAGDTTLDIRESDLLVPITAGVVSPCVILPLDWRQLSDTALTAILRHEAAHVRRRDCTVALGAALVEALFWFHPAVWWGSRRLRWFAEMACDGRAASAMDPQGYARELLTLSAAWSGARPPRYAITAGAETLIARRIRLLLDGAHRDRPRTAWLVAALVALAFTIPVSAFVRFSISRALPAPVSVFDHGPQHPHAFHTGPAGH